MVWMEEQLKVSKKFLTLPTHPPISGVVWEQNPREGREKWILILFLWILCSALIPNALSSSGRSDPSLLCVPILRERGNLSGICITCSGMFKAFCSPWAVLSQLFSRRTPCESQLKAGPGCIYLGTSLPSRVPPISSLSNYFIACQ